MNPIFFLWLLCLLYPHPAPAPPPEPPPPAVEDLDTLIQQTRVAVDLAERRLETFEAQTRYLEKQSRALARFLVQRYPAADTTPPRPEPVVWTVYHHDGELALGADLLVRWDTVVFSPGGDTVFVRRYANPKMRPLENLPTRHTSRPELSTTFNNLSTND